MVEEKPPNKVHTVFLHERPEWVNKEGSTRFLWRGLSIYPRTRTKLGLTKRGVNALPAGQVQPMLEDCKPCLVEACCEEDSLLSRKTRWSKSRQVLGITEEKDFTSQFAINLSISRIKGPNDALWLSCPCTGGSSWVFINWYRSEETRQKIKQHWDLLNMASFREGS